MTLQKIAAWRCKCLGTAPYQLWQSISLEGLPKLENFYIDDGLTSLPTEAEAFKFLKTQKKVRWFKFMTTQSHLKQ